MRLDTVAKRNGSLHLQKIEAGSFRSLITIKKNGEKRNAYRILVGMPEGKRPLERPRRKWVDNIKMDLREMGWYRLDRSGSG
jgi:hypothetical protein